MSNQTFIPSETPFLLLTWITAVVWWRNFNKSFLINPQYLKIVYPKTFQVSFASYIL